jgi:hypothetical protein
MAFNSPDIETFRTELDSNIAAVLRLKTDSHATIKIQSLLNITIYVAATRFLEASAKHIIYNCCIMRGDNQAQLTILDSKLKKFNNPEFTNIKDEIQTHLGFDIIQGVTNGRYTNTDISFLNEIVRNRHRNVHATYASSDWYNTNIKDISNDFQKEYIGLINILTYLDSLYFDTGTSTFRD